MIAPQPGMTTVTKANVAVAGKVVIYVRGVNLANSIIIRISDVRVFRLTESGLSH